MNFMDHQGMRSMERLRPTTTDAAIDVPGAFPKASLDSRTSGTITLSRSIKASRNGGLG